VLVLVPGRTQRVARRQHRLTRCGQIAAGQDDPAGDDLQHGPVHRPLREVEVHGLAGYRARLVPATEREQWFRLVDREQATRGAGKPLGVRARDNAGGRLGGELVLTRALEQMGLVDRGLQ
jgi:hypothetical protein